MKTGQKWLKTSKVLIAWKIWTDGQTEVKNVKLNKVRNSNKFFVTYQKFLLNILSLKKRYRVDASKWNIRFTSNSCQETLYVDDYF